MKGKNAIVTGGARGIGEAIARKLASMGANIIIWDVNADSAKETAAKIAAEFGVKGTGASVNVTDSAGISAPSRPSRPSSAPSTSSSTMPASPATPS